MTKWMQTQLGNITDVIMGQSPKSEYYNSSGDGLPFLQGNRTFGHKYPTFDTYTTNPIKIANSKDIIMSVRAPVGDLNITPVEVCIGRGVCALRMKNGNQSFLYYLMKYYAPNLINKESGTVFGSINRSDIENSDINIPDYDTQKKIARVLGALDDKIELNNKINQNLETQAQTLFKSWFIDFEPFGGQMPNNWKIGKVEDIVDLYDSQRIPLSNNQRASMKKVYPYYGATSVMDFVDNYIFDGKYLLLGEDGTVIDDKGLPILQYVWGKFWVNNHAHIMTGKNGFNVESLYLFFKQTNVKGIVTGAVQPKINQANLKMLSVNIPTGSVMNNFNKLIEPLFSLFRLNIEESRQLTRLRDILIPKLMSGEINVSNVDISALASTDKSSFSDNEE